MEGGGGGGRTKVGTKVRRIYPAIFAESNRSPPKRFTFASESQPRVSRRDLRSCSVFDSRGVTFKLSTIDISLGKQFSLRILLVVR